MHGRLIALAGALLTLACAATAHADVTVAGGQPIAIDGVVTSITRTSGVNTEQDPELDSVQPLTHGAYVVGARGIGGIVGVAYTADLPVVAGGHLELTGAYAGDALTATVEPDADGDGRGDTTQDPCPGDFADRYPPQPCSATTTIGTPLIALPDTAAAGVPQDPTEALEPGAVVAADGILTRWRIRAGGGTTSVLQLLRPVGSSSNTYNVVAESAPVAARDGDAVAVAARLPVRAGDRIGVRSVDDGSGDATLGPVTGGAGGEAFATQQPPATQGGTFAPNGTATGLRLLIQADVESDLDGDGRGDVSQDSADVEVTGSAPSRVAAYAPFAQGFTVTDHGPDAAMGITLRFHRSGGITTPGPLPAGMACGPDPAGAADFVVCTLARLDAGQSFAFAPTGPGMLPGQTASEQLFETQVTGHPDGVHQSLFLTTEMTYPDPVAPPPAAVARPCANVVKGTRDDDVLKGTVFGDRLVGGDGADLLKGAGGDDCLEGGTGNDVLDGGDGDDRLAGDSGNDRLLGGKGDDKLTGGRGNDRLSGAGGNDTISGGPGKDTISAGPGNDTINSVDGVREAVDCGSGRDTVRADRRDHLVHCEKITRKR
jgi:hypothetical protein